MVIHYLYYLYAVSISLSCELAESSISSHLNNINGESSCKYVNRKELRCC